jgi:hypothetical protein
MRRTWSSCSEKCGHDLSIVEILGFQEKRPPSPYLQCGLLGQEGKSTDQAACRLPRQAIRYRQLYGDGGPRGNKDQLIITAFLQCRASFGGRVSAILCTPEQRQLLLNDRQQSTGEIPVSVLLSRSSVGESGANRLCAATAKTFLREERPSLLSILPSYVLLE